MDTPDIAPVNDHPITAPVESLTEADLAALVLSQERLAHTAAQLDHLARQHAETLKSHEGYVAASNALVTDLRARYDLSGDATVDAMTGAITRK